MLSESELDRLEEWNRATTLTCPPGGWAAIGQLIAQARLAVAKESTTDVPAGSEVAAVLDILDRRYESRRAEFGKHPTTGQMAVLSEIDAIERLVKEMTRLFIPIRSHPMPNEVSDNDRVPDKHLCEIAEDGYESTAIVAEMMARELLTLRNQPTAAEVRDQAYDWCIERLKARRDECVSQAKSKSMSPQFSHAWHKRADECRHLIEVFIEQRRSTAGR